MRPDAEARAITRRQVLAAAAAGLAVAAGAPVAAWAMPAGSPGSASNLSRQRPGTSRGGPSAALREALHAPPPGLRLPALTGNGAKVPVAVEVDHPMEVGHHVSRIAVTNPRDPIPTKGELLLSPANGQAYLAFQARLDDGPSAVRVDVECSAGVRWSATEATRVVDGAGGCGGETSRPAATAPGQARLGPRGPGTSTSPGGDAARSSGEVRAPVIRVPELLRGRRLEPGQIVDVQVLIQHPVRTGLERHGDRWVQVSEPFYLTEMEVFMGGERVSRFLMSPAISDNPLIAFRLRPSPDGVIGVVFRNNRGGRFEAEHRLGIG
jgi:predicted secreted protein